ncbi:PREDICTED: poly(A)-specific ribonuclease PARN isoform X2 [Tarenaya hassleriana]|nr:PREDICTED: poly(A)-specific ribonuclease PARN isoform X2 [Tarenaya hassleriana]
MQYEDGDMDSAVEARELKLVRMADILFAERMKNTLSEWRSALLHGGNTMSQSLRSSNDSAERLETVFYFMRPALSLKGFTSHQLRVIKLVVRKHFGDLVYIHMDNENSCSQDFVVFSDSESDKENLMKEAKDERKKVVEGKIKSAIGFRHVIDLLSSEPKLIVGHNCFLDIAHVYNKFVGPLPSTAEEFVSSINECFPHIIDTKVLLNVNQMLHLKMKKCSTSLSSAFSLLCPQTAFSFASIGSDLVSQQRVRIEVEVDNVRYSNWSSGAKHEAGYDAFMTGCIFAQACSHLGVDFGGQRLAQNETLQNYINRLYLSWTNGDIIDLSTGQTTAEHRLINSVPKRFSKIKYENVVLIWGFQPKLKAREIKECICKVFGPTSVTSIYHVDDTAVFVMFKNPEFVSDFLELKQQLQKNDGPVAVLHPLSKLLEGGNTCAADYEVYKEVCSSSISKTLFAEQAEAVGINGGTRSVKSDAETERRPEEEEEASDNNNNNSNASDRVCEREYEDGRRRSLCN